MTWFKRKTWKKIGEVTICEIPFFSFSCYYYKYAIMECVLSNGDRNYKRVLIAKSEDKDLLVESQPEDPLKEINDILKS